MSDASLAASLTFCGRVFTLSELELIQQIVADFATLGINELAATVCELLEWQRPNGRLKDHECRQLLERLHQQGLLRLPALQQRGPRGPQRVVTTSASDPQPELHGSVGQFAPLVLERVEPDSEASRLWRELIARYHYLGCRVPVGANLRYLVRSQQCPQQVLACLLWSSPAWKMAVRDRWIGWSPEQRARNLPYIVNNSRFLILPWVRVRGLASQILSRSARQLPQDWQQDYGCRPLLLETLVDASRFAGTCYRAANWIALGLTTGRGRMDRHHQAHGYAPKQVYVYPLGRQVPQRLATATPPQFVPPTEEPD
ncbi:MAG: DUF4338 domain-containing protein [Anaerolineales bacterium]